MGFLAGGQAREETVDLPCPITQVHLEYAQILDANAREFCVNGVAYHPNRSPLAPDFRTHADDIVECDADELRGLLPIVGDRMQGYNAEVFAPESSWSTQVIRHVARSHGRIHVGGSYECEANALPVSVGENQHSRVESPLTLLALMDVSKVGLAEDVCARHLARSGYSRCSAKH
jgi:hypothetical protein